jgi:hypothetical protein
MNNEVVLNFYSEDTILSDDNIYCYDWHYITKQQKLSDNIIKFILLEKHEHYFERYYRHLLFYQSLSEDILEEHLDYFFGCDVCAYQKLSVAFIEKHANVLGWLYISKFQPLDETFIEKHINEVDFDIIVKHQKLSDVFLKKYNLKKPRNSWLYKSIKYKKQKILNTGLYEIIDDYVYAYKAVRDDYYSIFNFQYLYEIDKEYTSHADYDIKEENSFGLSAWTYEGAKNYYNKGRILKVKIHLDDVAALVQKGHKLRCTKITIIDEID